MKIAIVGPIYPFRGGIAQFAAQLAEEISQHHEVFCLNFKKQYPNLIFPGKTQFDKSRDYIDIKSKRLLTPYNPFTFSISTSALIEFKPDLVIFNYWVPITSLAYNYISKQLKKKMNTKIITICHNLQSHEKWFFATKLQKTALNFSDEIVTLSSSVAQEAKKKFPGKKVLFGFHPAYSFYSKGKYTRREARKELGFRNNEKIILFFGYVKPYKGLDLLLKAFKFLHDKQQSVHLLIVGEVYGDAKQYEKIIQDEKIEDKVTFLQKFVTNENVEKYFKAADVLALPYLSATQSGVAQIAFTMGLGVVVTPVGGLPEIVKNDKIGRVSKSMKPQDFAEALYTFLQTDREEITKYTLVESSKYTWKEFIKLLKIC
ncbi:MAG: glycosyltransferase family 4 protein [Candidatus Cloacimonetes bacterium]|nr:glycosyltransferase family 4 protein [Candidatus Cloacimonadota bacterium]MCF7813071.1 glycosyltransferase family 4 protein [Candidatus Cloacimonadota bacterium]MCF7867188.1 glycosyltransferase family 4 protein [Candidatus Cloacimonadota bacterium]MCF7882632.1 glycosyltransferase family 4 protein [Candidatus Cloacimonadota bacterium]